MPRIPQHRAEINDSGAADRQRPNGNSMTATADRETGREMGRGWRAGHRGTGRCSSNSRGSQVQPERSKGRAPEELACVPTRGSAISSTNPGRHPPKTLLVLHFASSSAFPQVSRSSWMGSVVHPIRGGTYEPEHLASHAAARPGEAPMGQCSALGGTLGCGKHDGTSKSPDPDAVERRGLAIRDTYPNAVVQYVDARQSIQPRLYGFPGALKNDAGVGQ